MPVQFCPLHSCLQMHVKELIPSTQTSLLEHELDLQSSISGKTVMLQMCVGLAVNVINEIVNYEIIKNVSKSRS